MDLRCVIHSLMWKKLIIPNRNFLYVSINLTAQSLLTNKYFSAFLSFEIYGITIEYLIFICVLHINERISLYRPMLIFENGLLLIHGRCYFGITFQNFVRMGDIEKYLRETLNKKNLKI